MSLNNNEKMDMLLSNEELINQVLKQQLKDQIFMIIVIGIMIALAAVCVGIVILQVIKMSEYKLLKEEIENLNTNEIIKLIIMIDQRAYTKGYIKGYKVGWDDHE